MVIKNKTVLSGEEALSDLVKIARKNFKTRFILGGVLAAIGIIVLIINLVGSNTLDYMVIGTMFIVFSLVYLIQVGFSYARIAKKVIANNPVATTAGMINNFDLKEESFIINVTIGDKSNRFEIPYTSLNSIIEYDNEIHFVYSSSQIFICKKSGFAEKAELKVFLYGLSKHKIKVKNKMTIEKQNKK